VEGPVVPAVAPTLVLWAPQGLVLPGVFVLSREKGEERFNFLVEVVDGSGLLVI